jgi:hypothetical protein
VTFLHRINPDTMRLVAKVALGVVAVVWVVNLLAPAPRGAAPPAARPAAPAPAGGAARPAAPTPTPPPVEKRVVVLDPGVALSPDFGGSGSVALTDVRTRRVGDDLHVSMTATPSEPAGGRLPIAGLHVVAAETFVVADGAWLGIRRARDVGLLGARGRDWAEVSPSPRFAPGISRRVVLVFPAPPAGTDAVELLVAWRATWRDAWAVGEAEDAVSGGVRRARVRLAPVATPTPAPAR